MAVLSSANAIRALAIFHLIIAYYFLVSPSTISDYNVVVLLSDSFGTSSTSPSFRRPSALSALLAAVLAYYANADLAATLTHEHLYTQFWSTQAPLRTGFFLLLCGWSYASRPGGLQMGLAEAVRLSAKAGAGENLGSGVILTWALLEMMCWFWVYITVREEAKDVLAKMQREQEIEREKIL